LSWKPPILFEEQPVSSLPLTIPAQPLGIVIRSGAPKPKPVRFWAYLWAADEEDPRELHWHEKIPLTHMG
jgi:hypothetical protein